MKKRFNINNIVNLNKQFAVHTFKYLSSTSLNIYNYSELKFGSTKVAKLFGYEMADRFYEEFFNILINNKCVIVPSAFNVVPIASTLLAHNFMNRLNILLVNNGYNTVEWTTMHRSMNYISDYCTMCKETRINMLKNDKLYINKDFIKNKTLIFVDDATISGAHEEKMKIFLKESKIFNNRIFCYYVKYTGINSEIESKLNKSGIRTINDYIKLINEPDHQIVVRAIRFLLDLPSKILEDTLLKLSDTYIDKLYLACLSKEYYKTGDYIENFKLVKARYDEIIRSQ